MNKKIAFIGTGAMGGAILQAACRCVDPKQITITDLDEKKAHALGETLGCAVAPSNIAAAEAADFILLCTKPQGVVDVLGELRPALCASLAQGRPKVLCSILAGVNIARIRAILGDAQTYPVIRLMPNTPALIGKGVMLYTCDEFVSAEDIADLTTLIADCGIIERLPEAMFDCATVSAGCTPAFAYLFMEALADGGVAVGLSREKALSYAAHALYGAAAMVIETGMHPGQLKDMVTSPGGSTIAGIATLEDSGVRAAAIRAVMAAYARNVEMGK